MIRTLTGQALGIAGLVFALLGLIRSDYDSILAGLVFLTAGLLVLALEILDRLPTTIRLRRGGDTYPVQRGGD